MPLPYIGTPRRREGLGINDPEGALDGRICCRTRGLGRSLRRDDAAKRALNRGSRLKELAYAGQAGGFEHRSTHCLIHLHGYLTPC